MYSLLSLVVVGVIADYIFVAIFRGMKKSKFIVTENSEKAFSFETAAGGFRIDRAKRELSYAVLGVRRSVPLDELARLKFGYADKSALLQEIFFGYELTDALSAYQDSNHWYTVQISTKQGDSIPLFTAGQYEPREFFLGWYIRLQEAILEKLGLFHDVHDYAQLVLDEIKDGFRESGCEMKYH